MKNDVSIPYQRLVIYKDVSCEVTVIEWPPGAETPWHDHGTGKGTVTVLEGRIKERVCDKYTKKSFRTFFHRAGDVFFETPNLIHQMKNISPVKAVTAHVYTSKLKMREYTEEELKGRKTQ